MRRILGLVLVSGLLGAGTSLCRAAEPEIAYSGVVKNWLYRTLVVVDQDGSNATELHRGEKFKRGSAQPSWSPGGDWVAFLGTVTELGTGLYKVRPDGSDLTKILCSEGTVDGVSYPRLDAPKWSPDGQWIAVTAAVTGGGNRVAIVGAGEVANSECTSTFATLYEQPYDMTTETGWWFAYETSWNHDGSRLAIFETHYVDNVVVDGRIQMVEIGSADDGTPVVVGEQPVYPLPADFVELIRADWWVLGLDWQRQSGNILLLTAHETQQGIQSTFWIDVSSGAWGHLIEGEEASWAPDNSRLVYRTPNDLDLAVAHLTYDAAGTPSVTSIQPLGISGTDPDWRREPLPVACSVAADCNDDNECTADACVAQSCQHQPLDDDSCGVGGWCVAGTCFEPECGPGLPLCDDGDDCTSDFCVDYECSYEPIPGCGPPGGAPGDPCTSGDDCLSGLCHPKKGVCK